MEITHTLKNGDVISLSSFTFIQEAYLDLHMCLSERN